MDPHPPPPSHPKIRITLSFFAVTAISYSFERYSLIVNLVSSSIGTQSWLGHT